MKDITLLREKINNQKGTFLTIDNLVVEYTADGQVIYAVNGVSLELKRGKTLGLVGETGAGKTSIAKAILRILPDPPAKIRQGEILLEGENLLTMSNANMRKVRGARISMIFQDPMTALNPVMKIGDQIAEVIQLHIGIKKPKAVRKAMKMLELVGIPKQRFKEYPHQFSGGMKQRVVIAMALACNPELLLADEPTTALDVTIQAQVLKMINDLKIKFNTSMLMITHDLGVVAEVCDDVAIIYAGQIIERGSKETIFNNPTHPYTVGLFGAVPDPNNDIKRLNPISGIPADPTNLPAGCHFSPRCPYANNSCRSGRIAEFEVEEDHFCRCIRKERREI